MILILAGLAGVGIYTFLRPIVGTEIAWVSGAGLALIIFYLIIKPLLTVPPCTRCGETQTESDSQGVIRCAGCGTPRADMSGE